MLKTHGLIDSDFFLRLARTRPSARAAIVECARKFNLENGEDAAIVQVQPSRVEGWLIPGLTVLVASIVVAVAFGPGNLEGSKARVSSLDAHKDICTPRICLDTGDLPDSSHAGSPVRSPIQPQQNIIALSDSEVDPMLLFVTSQNTGEGWKVAVSGHRNVASAARDIFLAVHLKGREGRRRFFDSDYFELCQAKKCYHRGLVRDTVNASVPVWIRRNKTAMRVVPPSVRMEREAREYVMSALLRIQKQCGDVPLPPCSVEVSASGTEVRARTKIDAARCMVAELAQVRLPVALKSETKLLFFPTP